MIILQIMHSDGNCQSETQSSRSIGRFVRTVNRNHSNSRSGSKDSHSGIISSFYIKSTNLKPDNCLTQLALKTVSSAKSNHETIKQKRLKYINNEKPKLNQTKQLQMNDCIKYQQYCKKQQQEIQQLKEEKRDIQIVNSQLKSSINQLQKSNRELYQELSALRQIQGENCKLRKRIEELEMNLAENNTVATLGDISLPEGIIQHQASLQLQLQNARKQVQGLRMNHNCQLRKAHKQVQIIKQMKDTQYLALKNKFTKLLNKFKDASKRLTTLEIRNILNQKKEDGIDNLTDITETFCLSSDEDKS